MSVYANCMPKSLTTMVSKAMGGRSKGWESTEIKVQEASKIKGDVGASTCSGRPR